MADSATAVRVDSMYVFGIASTAGSSVVLYRGAENMSADATLAFCEGVGRIETGDGVVTFPKVLFVLMACAGNAGI